MGVNGGPGPERVNRGPTLGHQKAWEHTTGDSKRAVERVEPAQQKRQMHLWNRAGAGGQAKLHAKGGKNPGLGGGRVRVSHHITPAARVRGPGPGPCRGRIAACLAETREPAGGAGCGA